MAMNQPGYYPYQQGYQQPYYQPPMQDQLAQLRGMQYQQPTVIPQPPQQNAGNGILWVQGEAGAKSYLVAPNASVLLMDSEGQRFYLKSVDGNGMPTMKTFEYTEVSQKPAQNAVPVENIPGKYVTREEFQALQGNYNELQSQYKELMDRFDLLTSPKKKKAVADDG